jgi:hypothetical protein
MKTTTTKLSRSTKNRIKELVNGINYWTNKQRECDDKALSYVGINDPFAVQIAKCAREAEDNAFAVKIALQQLCEDNDIQVSEFLN